MAQTEGDGVPVAFPTHHELITIYFGDVVPVTEHQIRVMLTYVQVFEKTYLPEEEKCSSENLRTLITDRYYISELFPHGVHDNDSIAGIFRSFVALCGLHLVPDVCRSQSVIIRSPIRYSQVVSIKQSVLRS